MKRASFGVLFFIKRAKKHKNGKLPVYARITINGLRAEFVVQASVEEILWDNKLGKVNGASKQAKEVNTFLESVKVNIVLKKRELEETGQQITALQLRTAFSGIDLSAHTIMGVLKEHNEMVKLVNKDFAPGTLERYNTCYVANFWRGMLYLLFCKYRDKNLRPGSHPALPAWVGDGGKYLIECSY